MQAMPVVILLNALVVVAVVVVVGLTVLSQTCAYGFYFILYFLVFFLFSTGFYGLCVNKATFKAL